MWMPTGRSSSSATERYGSNRASDGEIPAYWMATSARARYPPSFSFLRISSGFGHDSGGPPISNARRMRSPPGVRHMSSIVPLVRPVMLCRFRMPSVSRITPSSVSGPQIGFLHGGFFVASVSTWAHSSCGSCAGNGSPGQKAMGGGPFSSAREACRCMSMTGGVCAAAGVAAKRKRITYPCDRIGLS